MRAQTSEKRIGNISHYSAGRRPKEEGLVLEDGELITAMLVCTGGWVDHSRFSTSLGNTSTYDGEGTHQRPWLTNVLDDSGGLEVCRAFTADKAARNDIKLFLGY